MRCCYLTDAYVYMGDLLKVDSFKPTSEIFSEMKNTFKLETVGSLTGKSHFKLYVVRGYMQQQIANPLCCICALPCIVKDALQCL